jgi:uncharacterized protein (DUF1501 family)
MLIRRRDLLGYGAGLTFASLVRGVAMPGLLAKAADASAIGAVNDHALVVVELSGGNDGLNTVIPREDPHYYRNRRTIAIPKKDVIRLSDTIGLHPRMTELAALYRDGRTAIVQGVGYPEPNRSHFRSMEIWHTASTDPAPPRAGWLGRILDQDPAAGSTDVFPHGLTFTDAIPQALQTVRAAVPVVSQLDERTQDQPSAADLLKRNLSTLPSGAKPVKSTGQTQVDFLRRQAQTLYRTADKLKEATASVKPAGEEARYPEGKLADQLKRAGQILASGLGVRVLYCAQDGYDTHASQAESHANLLGTLSDSLAAFERDLTKRGLADRVMVLVFSEFGRRVDENASKGTDHGAASCVFLVGPKVKSGLVGTYPRLDKLGDGDLIYSTDFRSIYAPVIGRWLGCDSEKVLGGTYPALDLFA